MPKYMILTHHALTYCADWCDWCNYRANHFRKVHPPVKGVPPRSR